MAKYKRYNPKKSVNTNQGPVQQLTPELFQRKTAEWMLSPYKFAIEAMGFKPVGSYGKDAYISNQQYQLLEELRIWTWAKLFLREHKNVKSFDEMEKMLIEKHGTAPADAKKLVWYMQSKGILVASGKSCGKDCAVDGMIMPWALTCFDPVKVICSAPSESQLKYIMWKEFGDWKDHTSDVTGNYTCAIREWLEMRQEAIYFRNPFTGERDTNRVAFVKTVSIEDGNVAKTIDGFHAKNMFVIVNEVSKMDAQIMEQWENTTSDPLNMIIGIFNPTRRSGWAYDRFMGDRKDQYIKLQWDFEKTDRLGELEKQNHMINMEKQYGGKNTDGYRIYVKGEFGSDESGSYIPWSYIEDAEAREPFEYPESYPIKAGIDVGIQKDNTVITYFQGKNCIGIDVIAPQDHDRNEDVLGDEVIDRLANNNVRLVAVEGDGPGRLFALLLRKKLGGSKMIIRTVKVAEKASTAEYYQKRDELWGETRKMFREGNIKIFPNKYLEQLKTEMTSFLKVETDFYKGKIKLEGNHIVGKKLGADKSPDLASSFIIGCTTKEDSFVPDERYSRRRSKASYGRGETPHDFMAY